MAPQPKPTSDASKDASKKRLTDGTGHSIVSSPAARHGQPNDADDSIRRERFALVFGMAIRQVLHEPPPPPSQPSSSSSDDSIEVARGAEEVEKEEVEAPSSQTPQPVRRGTKRKLEADPMDEMYQKSSKIMKVFRRIRFSNRVEVLHMRRSLAICGRKPFVRTGSPTLRSTQPLRRPTIYVRPRRFSRELIDELAADADPETIVVMEETPKPTGCADTCVKDGCSPECSCLAQGLFCSPTYGCPCRPSICRNYKYGPITMLEHLRRKMELVELANKKTEEWVEKTDSTISSVGSSMNDEQSVSLEDDVDDVCMDEPDQDLANIAMVEEEEEGQGEAVAEDEDVENNGMMDVDWSPPPSPFKDPEDNSPDAQPPMDINATMRLSDSDDDAADPPSSDPSDDSSEDDEEDEEEDDFPEFDMAPEHFSRRMLRQLPALLDQGELNSCDDGELLGGDALFIGLLRVATAAKETTGSNTAVCHPNLFEKAKAAVRNEAARGAGPWSTVQQKSIMDYVAYGHHWDNMVIPMLINDNHWAVAVIRRNLVATTIYDSSAMPSKKAATTKALRKIIDALVTMNPGDKALKRYKLKYSRPACRDIQQDGTSCGLFVISHVRRALHRNSCSAAKRAGDRAIDVNKERMVLRMDLEKLIALFRRQGAMGLVWKHVRGGQLPCSPARTLVTLSYSTRRQ